MNVKSTKVWSVIFLLTLGLQGCSSSPKIKDKNFGENEEFEEIVQINKAPEESQDSKSEDEASSAEESKAVKANQEEVAPPKKGSTTKKDSKKVKDTQASEPKKSEEAKPEESKKEAAESGHPPPLEDGEGFIGRRPLKDPFRVGEKVVHEVSYFKVKAGELIFEVGPHVEVNDRKSYQFITRVESSSVFSMFYSVKDKAVTLVDYEDLVPHTFTLDVKESKQARDARSFYDHEKLEATYWEKKVSKDKGTENTKVEFKLQPYTQNVFSAAFYMRTFQWKDGKEYAFRVGDVDKGKGEILIFRGKVIKRERLKTEAGNFNAVVIKPEFEIKGVFKPVGDIRIWMSDDDRKIILRIESKIKIGTIVSQITKYSPGQD